MRLTRFRSPLTLALPSLLVAVACLGAQTNWLSAPEHIAPGVEFYKSYDQSLVEPKAPIAVFLLKLDPARVRLAGVLSNDEVAGAETVDGIAKRHKAIAAVNGGFFNVRNGEPASLLKIAGELVSDNVAVKGVVLIRAPARGRTELSFDQAAVRQALRFKTGGREWTVPVDGVDTTRERGKLMLYTPAYNEDTDTAANGIEWVLDGRPLKVVDIRRDVGRTPIPRGGVVLSFGGLDPPEALAALAPGIKVAIDTTWRSLHGRDAKHFDQADHIVNGAGLLKRDGRVLANWESAESLNPATFIAFRHPRTLIGVDARGQIWLAAIDGRQPEHSLGMAFTDLLRLCDRLGLRDALNLDGGGSTTMVVQDRVVNRPSDANGPRPVSDAILVSVR